MNSMLRRLGINFSRPFVNNYFTSKHTLHLYKSTRGLSQFRNKENHYYYNESGWKTAKKILVGTAVIGFLGYNLYNKKQHAYAKEKTKIEDVGKYKRGLPTYSMEEVSKHDSRDAKVWVTFKEGVYDITAFIEGHPGGEQILLAAGSSVEPFWVLYPMHESDMILQLLETYRIGNLRKEDVGQLSGDMSDPYSMDPIRHNLLKPASKKPFCGECPPSLLVQSFITPNELFYVRNHLPVPNIDPQTYELEVELEGKSKTVNLTLAELRKLPRCTITATVMCAGNRRNDMMKVKAVKGLNWGVAAIGNATWTGVRLRDVLLRAGIREDDDNYNHVQFEGIDLNVTGNSYGASIPFWRAIDKKADVLLAYEMNGVPIPRDHGFPVRVIVPGVAGARHVKWLGRIIVSNKESESHWQQFDYKGFAPSVDYDTVDFSKAPAIQELPVISAICVPGDGETIKVTEGHILVKGYAWSGGGQKIVRVDVTTDRGKTWHVASLDAQDAALPPRHWAWTLWSVEIPVTKDTKNVEIWAKAVDSCYNTQPENVEHIWNFRGVLSNAYHKIKVHLKH